MKKTISINLKGINFIIEEDAYESLQNYLRRLELTLSSVEDKDEIIDDVELRIAELCSGLLNESKTVIEKKDIEQIVETLGDPEAFIDEEELEEEQVKGDRVRSDRRLFRDVDNATLGGVCSGIANYFSIDVVVVRVIFVLMFLFAFSGFAIYMILWIVIPKAETSIDKLRMKGRPITVESLKDEVDRATGKLKDGSKRFASTFRKEDFRNNERINRGGRILANIVGIGLLIMALFFLIPFIIFVIVGIDFIPVYSDSGFLSLSDFSSLVLIDSSDKFLAWTGGILVSMSGILFLMLLGSMLLFKLRNKWTRLSLLGLFVIGLVGFIICLVIGLKTGRDFSIEGEIEQKLGDVSGNELVINSNLLNKKYGADFEIKHDDRSMLVLDDKTIEMHGIHFEFKLSADSNYHVYHNLSARSYTHKEAVARSKNIQHKAEIINDTLHLDLNYKFPRNDKIRSQEVKMIIEIPEGGLIKLNGKEIRLGSKGNGKKDEEHYSESGYLHSDGEYQHYD